MSLIKYVIDCLYNIGLYMGAHLHHHLLKECISV